MIALLSGVSRFAEMIGGYLLLVCVSFQPLDVALVRFILYDTTYMHFRVPFSVSLVSFSMLLVLASALAIRSSAPAPSVSSSSPLSASSVQDATTSTIPAFTSASYSDGDALKGLGPEWTVVEQHDFPKGTVGTMAGFTASRTTVVSLLATSTRLSVTEEALMDPPAFAAAVKKDKLQKIQIAGRDGYLIGGGFLLVGERTAVFFQQKDSSVWPTHPAAEVLAYIATVRVP